MNNEYTKLDENRILTKTKYGQTICVDTRDVSIAPHLIKEGLWEDWIVNAFRNIVKQGMVVVEVGSCFGVYTLQAAGLVGISGRVYAFDGSPENVECVKIGLKENNLNNVEIHNTLVTNKTKKNNKFFTVSNIRGANTIVGFNDEVKKQHWETYGTDIDFEELNIKSTSLDDFFKDKDKRVDIMKIDAEGSEALIIDGAKKLLEANPDIQIIMEFNQAMLSATIDPKEFLENLRDEYGFRINYIDSNSNIVDKTHDLDYLLNSHMPELLLSRREEL